jgi:hypothetical protein
MTPPLSFVVVNGALLEAPIHEPHHRGINWAAIIDIEPTAPGGLGRRWLQKANGGGYMVTNLDIFDAIEFAADYKSFAGNKYAKRWYGVVVEKRIESVENSKGQLVLRPCATGRDACLESIRLREATT